MICLIREAPKLIGKQHFKSHSHNNTKHAEACFRNSEKETESISSRSVPRSFLRSWEQLSKLLCVEVTV